MFASVSFYLALFASRVQADDFLLDDEPLSEKLIQVTTLTLPTRVTP